MRTPLLVVLSVALIVACAQEMPRRERMAEAEAVEEQLVAWVQAQNNLYRNGLNRQRLDSLAPFYLQNDQLQAYWPMGGRTLGWEEFDTRMREFFGTFNHLNMVMTDPRVEVMNPTAALSTFRHSTDVVLGARARSVNPGGGTILWVKDRADGEWKIHLQHISWDNPAGN
ncbi:MAG: nuclear transport factor 2 family protein [Gemmatimonadales bacterium]|jgi:hypothetical protein